MEEKDETVEQASLVLERAVARKLEEVEKLITNESWKSEEELQAVLEDANSLISFVCAENDDLYNGWRYRMIKSESGKIYIIQGEEIDVDVRKKKRG